MGDRTTDSELQKGEAMDSRLLAIADGFGEGVGKVREITWFPLKEPFASS